MIGKERALEILGRVISKSDGDETDALLLAKNSALTRFSNSVIHQNVSTTETTISVRVVKGKRIGVASTDRLQEEESLSELVKRASEIADLQRENPNFFGLPRPNGHQQVDAFCEATAEYSPAQRAEAVKTVVEVCKKDKISASGSFSTSSEEIAIVNSHGVAAYFPSTSAQIVTVVMRNG